MKTQIASLINGSSKFSDAQPGTAAEVRNAIALAVHFENPEQITLEIDGTTFILSESHSLSGKSWKWQGEITEGEFIALTGDASNYAKSPLADRNSYQLTLLQDCTLIATKTSAKHNHSVAIRESRVTIK